MKHLLTLLALLMAWGSNAQKIVDSRQREIVIKNVSVLPMNTETVLANQTVVVKNGEIAAMGTKVVYAKDALVIDAKGKFLMPGLAEMHAHVPPVDDIEPMKEVLLLFAANGVTTIRGMLGHPLHLELRKKIQTGEILGPRLYTSGPSFSGASVKTPEEGIERVRSQKRAGYDFMKMHPGLSKSNFEAVIKAANEEGMTYGGHVSFNVGLWRSVEANYATIDHLDGIVQSLIPRLDTLSEDEVGLFGMFAGHRADLSQLNKALQAIREHHIWIVPTQTLAEHWQSPKRSVDDMLAAPEMKYMSKAQLASWATAKQNTFKSPQYKPESVLKYNEIRKKVIYECQKQGVGLLLGSDAPQVFSVPGFSLKHELTYLVEAGLTPYEALRTGTYNVGQFFKNDNLGVIKKGAVADLVLLNANPMKDISAVGEVEGVMLNGKWLSKEEIQSTLKKLEK
ncbi:amidohydrolase family protein [Runella limosa]|uniref:amidohydrolase family protein n=1 Tax=Runella limosa TaxID=370978 RepID=UPI0004205775|nr:amidohydrolase family protein [Runella limosa]